MVGAKGFVGELSNYLQCERLMMIMTISEFAKFAFECRSLAQVRVSSRVRHS